MPAKQTDPQFKMRLPADLKRQLEEAADHNDRTISAEIIARLRVSFDKSKDVEILNEIQNLRSDFNKLNTQKFVEMVARAGNFLARHERPPTAQEIADDEERWERENSLQENIGPEDENIPEASENTNSDWK